LKKIFTNYILFSLIYFSTRGILINEYEFKGGADVVISGFIRFSSLLYFLYKIFNFKASFNNSIIIILRVLQTIVLMSFFVNNCSIEQLIQFETLVFYPIGIAFMIIDWLDKKEIKKVIIILLIWLIFQFIYTTIDNFSLLLSLTFEDPFNGFFGYPRAYHFSFFTIIIGFLVLILFEKEKVRKKYYLPIFLLFLTPILSGSGRLVFCTIISIVIVFSLLLKTSVLKKIILIVFSILLIASFEIYANELSYGGNIYSEFLENPTSNLKIFYFYESFKPLLNDPILFIFGHGPGNYMSNAAQSFRSDLVLEYNDNLHFKYGSDIYQGFNNIIGFIGDVGLIFFILYYRIFYIIFKDSKMRTSLILIPTILIIIYSSFFQVFDDPYYSLSVWLFVGVILKWKQLINVKKQYEN
jgi:hypothetical protein